MLFLLFCCLVRLVFFEHRHLIVFLCFVLLMISIVRLLPLFLLIDLLVHHVIFFDVGLFSSADLCVYFCCCMLVRDRSC